MMNDLELREFVISCDGMPHKIVRLSRRRISRFCARLVRLYPHHRWGVSHRFLSEATD